MILYSVAIKCLRIQNWGQTRNTGKNGETDVINTLADLEVEAEAISESILKINRPRKCSGRGTSDADKNRAVPSVALQQESLFSLKERADEPMARVPKMAGGKIFGHATFIFVPLYLFILPNHRLHIVRNVCLYTHIWQRGVYAWIAVTTKQYCKWNVFTQIGSGAKCWLDINHWVPAWRWLGGYVHWTKCFTIFVSNRT